MIKYTLKVGDEVATLECETMEQLIQYLKAERMATWKTKKVVGSFGVSSNYIIDRELSEINLFDKTFSDRMSQINNAPNYID